MARAMLMRAMLLLLAPAAAVVVSGAASLPSTTMSNAFTSLATPTSWRNCFLFTKGSLRNTVLDVGDTTTETAGAPPILPIKVQWTCREADADGGVLRLESEGVAGVIEKVERRIVCSDDGNGGCSVSLETEFEGAGPLAVILEPLIRIDHALSMAVLLPGELGPDSNSRKTAVVWAILISVYVLQNLVWMTAFGIIQM